MFMGAYDSAMDTEEPEKDDALVRWLKVADLAIGVALTAYVLWEMADHDDPLGWPARAKRWAATRRLRALAARRTLIELASWGIDLELFLEREVRRWGSEAL